MFTLFSNYKDIVDMAILRVEKQTLEYELEIERNKYTRDIQNLRYEIEKLKYENNKLKKNKC